MYIQRRKTFHHSGNAAGNARVDADVSYQSGGIGVCLYIKETNFPFPQMLYKSECHQH